MMNSKRDAEKEEKSKVPAHVAEPSSLPPLDALERRASRAPPVVVPADGNRRARRSYSWRDYDVPGREGGPGDINLSRM